MERIAKAMEVLDLLTEEIDKISDIDVRVHIHALISKLIDTLQPQSIKEDEEEIENE